MIVSNLLARVAAVAAALVTSHTTSGRQEAPVDLARELAAAVDLPAARARRDAANALAARKEIALEDWLLAMKSFGSAASTGSPNFPNFPNSIGPSDPGAHVETVPLQVGAKIEDTELARFVPRSYDPHTPAPLMLALHGTGGSGKDVEPMWRAVAEKLGMLVLAPSEAGPNEGYAFSDRERDAAMAALRWMRRRYNIDENRIFASGISRGGHMAWDLALRAPDLFAALAPMIGSPRFNLNNGQNNLRFLENLVAMPIRDLQGSKDDPGVLFNLHLSFDKLTRWKAPDAKLIEFPERGHDFDFGAVDWVQFLGAAARHPTPDRVVRTAAVTGEARAFWVEITALGKNAIEDLKPRVTASEWNKLDDDGRRRFLEAEVEKHTARLEVKRTAPGRFTATGLEIVSFRLLLADEMFDAAKTVQVVFNGKTIEKKARADKRALLQEFVERFDRTFLPVAAVDVP